MTQYDPEIEKAAEILSSAQALVICAGAGMGVDSGLPDFRGDEGFWKAYPPLERLGISFYEMASPRWFQSDPELAWGFYGHRLNLYRDTTPHRGFEILKTWSENMEGGVFIFTSNVDGHFQTAGFSGTSVYECHGSIHHLQCVSGCSDEIWPAADIEVVVDETTFRATHPLPRCPACGGLARPNVLMFGDWGWTGHRTSAQGNRFEAWLTTVRDLDLAIIEVGAGMAVPTVRMTSERLASACGGRLIRINPREAQVPRGHISIAGGALSSLEEIDAIL